ncbi:MAG: hypothetical protein ACERKY_13905 [Anaerolineales bacterium]
MGFFSDNASNDALPITRDLTLMYKISAIIAILMTIASVSGLLFSSAIYPTDDVLQTFFANDVVNLLIGLPILIGSMWLSWRGKLIGLLLWPGALLYVLYNYTAYLFGLPLNWTLIFYLLLVLLSAITVTRLIMSIDGGTVRGQLEGLVFEKLSGGFLFVFGVLFILRAISIIADAIANQTVILPTEISVLIADMILSALWIAGGVLLFKRSPLGYVSGLGLLFSAIILFVGLIVYLLLQPVLTDVPFVVSDVIVIIVMGLVCCIPFALFVRGVTSSEKSP